MSLNERLFAGDFGVEGGRAGTRDAPRSGKSIALVCECRVHECFEAERGGDEREEEGGERSQAGGCENHFLKIADGIIIRGDVKKQ